MVEADLTGGASVLDDRASVIFVSDLTYEQFDPADLFDLAFLLRSAQHELIAVCLAEAAGGGQRIVDALARSTGTSVRSVFGPDALLSLLTEAADQPVNLVVVGAYSLVADVLRDNKTLFRRAVSRLFIVGGCANDYGAGHPPAQRRLPVDPRLEQQNPERFSSGSDLRLHDHPEERRAWGGF